jgi:WS/DGAT/MGAT family acyltransferase
VVLVDRPGAGTTILCRVHHAIADGFGLLGLLLSLCDAPPMQTARPASRSALFGAAKALLRLVMLPPDAKTVLKGELGREKRLAWTRPVALGDVKAAARASSATVNDVLVSVAAGALGRYLVRRGANTHGLEIHAMVPVNLRPADAPATLGNRFGLVVLGLPVGIADPRARVAAVKERMTALKQSPEAIVAHGLLGAMGFAPRPIEDLGVAFFGAKSSLVLTNVPGPKERLSFAGVPLRRILFWVPQSGPIGLGISILSYAGEVTVGVLADAELVPDPDALVSDLHAELSALRAD